MNVLVYVQHLRGIGHLRRINHIIEKVLLISRAEITIVCGGKPFRNDIVPRKRVRIVRLPYVYSADQHASVLVTASGAPIKSNHEFKAMRRQQLLNVLREREFDVVLIEMYPFGRRAFKFELKPFLNHLHSLSVRPAILCSVRDVLVHTNHPTKHDDIADVATEYFDRILVHSDPNVIPFSNTFTQYDRIRHMVSYTGFVTPSLPTTKTISNEMKKIVISCGSGLTGNVTKFFKFCLDGLDLVENDERLKILCLRGALCSDSDLKELNDLAKTYHRHDIETKRHVLNGLIESGLFPNQTRMSISMGGYNTTLESIKCGIPTILIPFHTDKDHEQLERAQILHRHLQDSKPFVVLSEMNNVKVLTCAVANLMFSSHTKNINNNKIHLDGADVSAKIILEHGKIVCSKRRLSSLGIHLRSPSSLPFSSSSKPTITTTRTTQPQKKLTIVLLNYRRPENVQRLVKALLKQTVCPQIYLWNNSEKPFQCKGITWQVDSSSNKYCWVRWFMASLASTPYVMVMDDDLIPRDDMVLEDAVQFLSTTEDKSTIIGPFGIQLNPHEPYCKGRHVNVHHFPWHKSFSPSDNDTNLIFSSSSSSKDSSRSVEAVRVDIIKGRTMMMRTEALQTHLGFVFGHSDTRGDDIAVSGSLAQGYPRHHLIPRLFHRRLVELPAPHALCDVKGHYERRECVRRRFFTK